ncbi:MAG: ABC transporter permease [Eubacteriales bacterium]|nr:ABC transporter permease [Eubacteriales bacterium]
MLSQIKYQFQIYLREKNNFIWNFIFPFVFILIYIMAMFALPSGSYQPDPIEIAVVEGQEDKDLAKNRYALTFPRFLSYMGKEAEECDMTEDGLQALATDDSISNSKADATDKTDHTKRSEEQEKTDQPLIKYIIATEEDALDWLKQGKIYAVVYPGPETHFTVKNADARVAPLILNGVLEAYMQTNTNLEQIQKSVEEGRLSYSDLFKIQEQFSGENLRRIDKSQRKQGLPESAVYHFAMAAYICFYPVNAGIQAVSGTEAYRWSVAMREAVSPRSKRKRFLVHILPVLCIHLILTTLFFFFLRAVVPTFADAGSWTYLLFITTSLAAIFTGTAIASIFSFREEIAMAMAIAIPLIFGFTSGLMNAGVRNMITNSFPLWHKLNPLGACSTALYILKSGGGMAHFQEYYFSILIYTGVAALLSLIGLRRSSYESL